MSSSDGAEEGSARIPLNEVVHLRYLFCLGVPGYRTRLYLSHNLSTTHRAFRLFREAIYDASLAEMEALSGELELDESLFGGKRKGKRGWGAEGKRLVFGMYGRTHINGIEGFFSYAKTWLYHYRGVPSQYFHLHLKETEFGFNHRDEDIFALIVQLLVKPVPDV